jgi:hypothetical protein
MLAAIAPNGFVASLLVPIFFTFVILFSGAPCHLSVAWFRQLTSSFLTGVLVPPAALPYFCK